MTETSESDFFEDKGNDMATLVYCLPAKLQHFETLAKNIGYSVLDNETSVDKVRNLDSCDCVIVTDANSMRGIDYKCPTYGIRLLIARSFANTRHLHQGLGRVGRYGAPCKRFILSGVKEVDETEEMVLNGKLGRKPDQPPYRGVAGL